MLAQLEHGAAEERMQRQTTRPSSCGLIRSPRGRPVKQGTEMPARDSADDVTMSGRVEWWAEEVANERVALAEDERERLSRRRAARLAACEEQDRRMREQYIARLMDADERMEEREAARRMEEAERLRRIKEAEAADKAALLEQHAQRSSALHSFVLERDRILSGNGTPGGAAPRVEPMVSLAMERELQVLIL